MHLPTNPTAASMLTWNRDYVNQAETLLAPLSKNLACSHGCSWCCSLHVTVKPYELFALQEILDKLSEDVRTKITNQAATNWRQLTSLSAKQTLSINLPCPFLDDNSCMIYDSRPFSCRSAHSTSEPVCKEAYNAPADLTIIATQKMSRAEASFSFEDGIEEKLWDQEYDVASYSFNGVILEMLKGNSWQERWCAQEDAFDEELYSRV